MVFGAGISILNKVISLFCGSSACLDAVYRKAAYMSFSYEDVLTDTVNGIKLDYFLNDAKINPLSSKHLANLLDSGKIYLVTSTVKSCRLSVFPKTSSGANLDVDLDQIESIVSTKVKLSRNRNESTAITYEGNTSLVFGMRPMKLVFNKGRFEALRGT